jgi:hypothetical protein
MKTIGLPGARFSMAESSDTDRLEQGEFTVPVPAAVIEGCTEIGLLVGQEHTAVALFDTTRSHAGQAVAATLR